MSLCPPHYICKTCNQRFSRASVLRDHENVHSGKKPYLCKQCGRRFANHGSCHQHQRTHLKRQHKCACGKVFGRPRDLKRHLSLGKAECGALSTDSIVASDKIDLTRLTVSDQISFIPRRVQILAQRCGYLPRTSCSPHSDKSIADPYIDLLLRSETTSDYTMGTFRALAAMTVYQLRVAVGDVAESSCKEQIQASSKAFHWMIDRLASSTPTLLMAIICAQFLHGMCTDNWLFIDREYTQAAFGHKASAYRRWVTLLEKQQLLSSRLWGIQSQALGESLYNNCSELLHMATALMSCISEALRTLFPTANYLSLKSFQVSLIQLRMFIKSWNAFSACVQPTSSRKWSELEVIEGHIEGILQRATKPVREKKLRLRQRLILADWKSAERLKVVVHHYDRKR